jgi:nitroreductase
MAALLVLLTAVDEGLAACFFGLEAGRVDAFRAAFGVPADQRPVGVVSVGYAAPDRRSPSLRRGRRPVAEVTSEGRFGVPYRRVTPPA